MPSSELAACGDALASKLRFLLPRGARDGANTCCGRSPRPGLTPRINLRGSGRDQCPARAGPAWSDEAPPALTSPARRCAAPVRPPGERPPATRSSRWQTELPGSREGAEAETEREEAVVKEEAEAPARSRRREPGGCGSSGRGPTERAGQREETLCEARQVRPGHPPASSHRPRPCQADKHSTTLPLSRSDGGRLSPATSHHGERLRRPPGQVVGSPAAYSVPFLLLPGYLPSLPALPPHRPASAATAFPRRTEALLPPA